MAGFIEHIRSIGSGLWQKDSESVMGIDMGASALKVVQIKKKRGQAVLETYGEIALGPYGGLSLGQATNLETQKLKEAMTDLLKEAHVTAQKVAVSIPLQSSLVTLIEMPNPGERELPAMIPIEARKYIPVPMSEVTLDWWVMPKTEEKESEGKDALGRFPTVEVLLVAIHNRVLKKYEEVLHDIRLDSMTYEIESFSSARSVLAHDMLPTLVLDVGAGTTKITVIDYGVARMAHSVSKGSQDITLALTRALNIDFAEAEDMKRTKGLDGDIKDVASSVIDMIFFEANRVISNYTKKHNRAVSRVILIGGGSLLLGFMERAKEYFKLDVYYGDPFSKVKAPAFLEPVLRNAGPEFAIAIGLSLRKLSEIS